MSTFTYKDTSYEVDQYSYLLDFNQWNEIFAEGMALQLKITDGLTKKHWDVIYFIRNTFKKTGKCPLIYETCRTNKLHLKQLRSLFPTGYQRGVCRIAGITYKEGYYGHTVLPKPAEAVVPPVEEKTYTVDIRGFLVNPDEWDEFYAVHKALDMRMPNGELTEKHWQIIWFLRKIYEKNKTVPTVYETCEANGIELDELERLFPDGYHRGAVKIAGLRIR